MSGSERLNLTARQDAWLFLVLSAGPERFDSFEEWTLRHGGFPALDCGEVVLSWPITGAMSDEEFLAASGKVIKKIEFAGWTVKTVDYDLVTTGGIAKRTGRTPQTIRQYIAGAIGPGGFPEPVGRIGRWRRWDWAAVNSWLIAAELGGEPGYHPPKYILDRLNKTLPQLCYQ